MCDNDTEKILEKGSGPVLVKQWSNGEKRKVYDDLDSKLLMLRNRRFIELLELESNGVLISEHFMKEYCEYKETISNLSKKEIHKSCKPSKHEKYYLLVFTFGSIFGFSIPLFAYILKHKFLYSMSIGIIYILSISFITCWIFNKLK